MKERSEKKTYISTIELNTIGYLFNLLKGDKNIKMNAKV